MGSVDSVTMHIADVNATSAWGNIFLGSAHTESASRQSQLTPTMYKEGQDWPRAALRLNQVLVPAIHVPNTDTNLHVLWEHPEVVRFCKFAT